MTDERFLHIPDWPASASRQRTVLFEDDAFLVERVDAVVERPFTTYTHLQEGIGCVIITELGNALVRSELSSRWYLVPQKGVTVRMGEKRFLIREGRGTHIAYAITWNLKSIPTVVPSLNRTFERYRSQFGSNAAPYQCIEPHFQNGYENFLRLIQPGSQLEAPALLTAIVAEAVSFMGETVGQSLLAPTPLDLPETIRDLVGSVRQSPEQPWPLKLASDQAGYSPFHFSRTFKQLTGYGFHEFVDRTRTELAVEILCSTDEPVDSVSVSAGFGTTQGMRESMREYLGMVPSEVRAEPDESLIS